jgi:hypothetical protein
VPGYICGQGRAGVRQGVRNGPRGDRLEASQQSLWSGNCWNGTKVTNPGFTSLALHEKRGVTLPLQHHCSRGKLPRHDIMVIQRKRKDRLMTV